jgi:hypothetical protein
MMFPKNTSNKAKTIFSQGKTDGNNIHTPDRNMKEGHFVFTKCRYSITRQYGSADIMNLTGFSCI